LRIMIRDKILDQHLAVEIDSVTHQA